MTSSPYDFHTPAAREVPGGLKWGKYEGRDILPMWVADMDFLCPPEVLAALHRRVDDGIFGYGSATDDQVGAVVETLAREFQWEVDPTWLVWLPGLVSGITQTCRACGEDGDEVLVNTPVYPPFLKAPRWVDRRCVKAPLAGSNTEGWRLDADAMRAAITDRTALYLLCHPHNPVGRMWTEEELRAAAEVCLENDVVICSDEIHNQLILTTDRRHRPLATLSPEIAARTITLLAPSKTFNVPGLGCSLAIIPDSRLRRRFEHAGMGIVPHVNVLGLVAAGAAWREAGAWLAELRTVLRGNRDYLRQRVAGWSGVTMPEVEATYLAWLDVRSLGLEDPVGHFEQHGLGLSDGADFDGAGHVRLNFGCSRELLEQACDRFERGLEAIS